MQKYLVSEVLTPSSPATQAFVERTVINDLLVDALRTKGKQIVIYGHTGSGKTTVLYNKLNQTYDNFISTSCTMSSSFQEIVLNAFDRLGALHISEVQNQKQKKISLSTKMDYKLISGQIGYDSSSSTTQKIQPLVPPQLNAQKLASFFGSTNSCWVIDDFHKMPAEEKKHLAQWMKVFMDESIRFPNVKIIVIGAVGKAKDIISLDFELNNRVSEVYVPFMTETELLNIIELAEVKLNIKIESSVKIKIVRASNGVPSIVHQLCLNLCNSKGLNETSETLMYYDVDDYHDALKRHVMNNSGFLQDRYEAAIKEKDNTQLQVRFHLIRCFLLSKKTNFTVKDVAQYFISYKHPQSNELLRYVLNDLTKDTRGKIFTEETNEDNVETWFFSDPFIKVYCMCIIDLNAMDIHAQYSLFEQQSIAKTRDIQKKEQMELINRALSSAEFFDF